jgi:curved DNA-binding protein
MAVGYRDYYELLGVPRDASTEDVRRAYRQLARQYHPDVNKEPGAEDRFKEISEAYEVLRDPEKRERYDRLGSNWRAGQDVSGASGYDDGDARSGYGGPFGGFEDDDFSELFQGLFSRRRGARARAGGGFDGFSQRGSDRRSELELTLEEAARGGRRRLVLSDGRELEVEIPPGVRDGQVIRLAGEGGPGMGGAAGGDLLLRVRLRPDPRFRVIGGGDLETDLQVAPWEAALGAQVSVPTLDGNAKVKVPAGSSCGRRLRLRGAGLGGGDLYAVVRIVVPKRLSKRERELFQQLADTSTFDPRRT